MVSVKVKATVITGEVGKVTVEIMLDTGSSLSLLRHEEALLMKTNHILTECPTIELITASGEPLLILSCIEAPVQITGLFKAVHKFLVVHPVILGTDFLYKHQLCLDFASTSVTV